MVGARLRQARTSRNFSLDEVATRARVSTATLSRIERDKQGLDFGLFLILCKILRSAPHEILGGEPSEVTDPLAGRISSMQHEERMQLWRDLTESRHSSRDSIANSRKLSEAIEELVAQFEFLRAEVEAVHMRIRRR